MAVRQASRQSAAERTVYLTEALRNARCARIVWMPLQVSLGIGRIHSFRESKMRVRTVASDVLFTVSALAAVVGVHKYIFGDFPKLWFVRQWPWHAVNPWVACGLSLVLAWVAARLARSQHNGDAPPTPTPVIRAAPLPLVGERIPTQQVAGTAPHAAPISTRTRPSA